MVTIITTTATDFKFGLSKIILFLVRTNKKALYSPDKKMKYSYISRDVKLKDLSR